MISVSIFLSMTVTLLPPSTMGFGRVVVKGNSKVVGAVAAYRADGIDLLEIGTAHNLHGYFHARRKGLKLKKDGDLPGDLAVPGVYFPGIEMYLGDLASCVADTMIGVLGLEDGTRVEGTGFGAPGVVSGELVFTTIMSGYEEALTDPSYHGQMLMFTYPLQGNYGVSGDDFQSDRIWPKAMVSREYWDRPTHYRSVRTLNQFLNDEGKPGICGVDTRMLTLKVRTQGVMRATIAVGEKR